MRTYNQAGAAERTAAAPAETPSAARRADEFSASRRGVVRKYLYDHPRVMDLVVILVYLLMSAATFQSSAFITNAAVNIALVLVSCVVLIFRRDKPLVVLALLLALEIVNVILVHNTANLGVGLWFALYVVALNYSRVFSFSMAAAVSAPLAVYTLFFYQIPKEFLGDNGVGATESNVITVIVMLLFNIIAAGAGTSVRLGRAHEEELRQWAVRNAQLASVAERNRIAREMHDIVAHSLTVMVALSDGAAVVVSRNPEQAAGVLSQLSQTGRTALSDMRRVLGVLREDDSDRERTPQPASADLGALIEGFRQAGMPLNLTFAGPSLPADPALQLTVYRIVQESLTNVLRYGTDVSWVRVRIENDPAQDVLRVTVADDGHGSVDAPLGTGQGIVGMRERARIYAGTVHAGKAIAGGWAVDVTLRPREGRP
ncbi:sensor histidine kinase [Arthrobacter cryoconiti]|uniref:histidine kinase n=1 Tax=Arthrobacter cryoconiti TaxID=748907 RepID=A0ABV8R379_9MICC|nr:histidine kinase [Arthrobacter cryoconiti]MCC9067826.1 histidine kinase [Arthrobacter cryoconiti]